jgi:hypothetical protein
LSVTALISVVVRILWQCIKSYCLEHFVITVPDEDMYEQGEFPSTFNNDHKWTFSIHKQRSWSDRSRNILDMMIDLGAAADVQKIEMLNATFRYGLPRFDQTLILVAESGIEIIVRKRPSEEIEAGGRLPPPGELPDLAFRLLTGLAPPKRS